MPSFRKAEAAAAAADGEHAGDAEAATAAAVADSVDEVIPADNICSLELRCRITLCTLNNSGCGVRT